MNTWIGLEYTREQTHNSSTRGDTHIWNHIPAKFYRVWITILIC